MAANKKVISPLECDSRRLIAEKIKKQEAPEKLTVDFSKLKLQAICLNGRFNNHFKDEQHFQSVVSSFLGTILPKVTSHTFSEICEGSAEGRILHFHKIDEEHRRIVREVLECYSFSAQIIDQMFEGNNIFEFSANLGHVYAARIVCHKLGNVLSLLFFDTNHHIYLDEKYVKESLFYEDCPVYQAQDCPYMPMECFAVGCLDENKIRDSYGYLH